MVKISNSIILQKSQEFKVAMDIYHDNIYYNKLGLFISTTIMLMQLISIYNLYESLITSYTITLYIFITLLFAYIFTDFINGLIHMHMDNNTNYKSIVGPLIAAFHMHHKNQKYKIRNPILIYFFESGSKIWLVFYLGILIFLQLNISNFLYINLFLTAVGILSSFAELSHYWCHNADKHHPIISKLQKVRILLPPKHHKKHHIHDNMNYAFLNGMTDPILNIIARFLYKGYKSNSDLHAALYEGKQTDNR